MVRKQMKYGIASLALVAALSGCSGKEIEKNLFNPQLKNRDCAYCVTLKDDGSLDSVVRYGFKPGETANTLKVSSDPQKLRNVKLALKDLNESIFEKSFLRKFPDAVNGLEAAIIPGLGESLTNFDPQCRIYGNNLDGLEVLYRFARDTNKPFKTGDGDSSGGSGSSGGRNVRHGM